MTNRVWLDVYDNSTLLRLGAGPVFNVMNATIRRPLDGSGTFRVRCSAADPRALSLLQVNRIVRIWSEDSAGIRLRGEGIIANWKLTESPTGIGLSISGPDILEELKRKNTLLGRIYNQQTLQTVCDDLISLAPGWAIDLDTTIASEVVDARFDGLNVFKAFRDIALRYGYHIRSKLDGSQNPADGSRTLEIGPFGTPTGLRVFKTETIGTEALNNPSLLMVQEITSEEILESNNYYNVIIPTAAGEGVAAVTLREAYEANGNAGRSYPIQLMTGPDGSTIYYISTTTYPSGGYADFTEDPGSAQKVGQYKDIAPLSNSLADRRNASEAVYDAAVSDLELNSVTQKQYALSVKNAKQNILPGDKIHINYKAQVETPLGLLEYLNIRDDFFVLSVDESVTLDGGNLSLEVSNLPKFKQDEIELIFDTIDQMEIRNLKPNVVVGPPSPYTHTGTIFAGFPFIIPIEFTDATLELLRVRLRFQTEKLVTFLSATGGSHRHRMFRYNGDFGGTWSGNNTKYIVNAGSPFYGDLNIVAPYLGVTADMWTDGASGDLALNFDTPTQDTQTPYGITFHYNGSDVTNTLFGVSQLAPTGGEINVLADAGALANLLTNAPGGLNQLHELQVQCTSGRGAIKALVEVFATTQAIKVST